MAAHSRQKRKNNRKKMKKSQRILLGVFLSMLVLIVILLMSGYMIIQGYINKANYVDDKEVIRQSDVSVVYDASGSDSNESDIEYANQNLEKNLTGGVLSADHVTNILLIGTDRRDESWYGNSDSIILVSINNKTKQIIMTSIMRDTYAAIPDYGNSKINLSHALGGGPLLVQTVEQNFRIDIDYYVSINFEGFMNVIDQIGGIPMTLSEDEVRVANNYIRDMNKILGLPEGSGMLSGGGHYTLTGKQALAYSRIRYVGNADYERTERQRNVLTEVFNKAKTLNAVQLNDLANAFLPNLTHNIPANDVLGLIIDLPTLISYNIGSERIPYDGLYQSMNINGQGMLVPDWESTIQKLQSTIYAE